jgi:hypothetical protein
VSFQATYQATTTLTGSGVGPNPLQDTQQTAPINTNAPPMTSFALAMGANTITLPASAEGFAFTRVQMMPPAGSANQKYLTTSAPARVIPSASANYWTTGSITLPAGPGDSVYINSAGAERLILAFS